MTIKRICWYYLHDRSTWKIWRPTVISKYTTPNLDDKDINDILYYRQYGKCVCKPDLDWNDDSTRVDIITYNKTTHAAELEKDLSFDTSVKTTTRKSIASIVVEFVYCFIKEGAKRTNLG